MGILLSYEGTDTAREKEGGSRKTKGGKERGHLFLLKRGKIGGKLEKLGLEKGGESQA